MHKLPQGVLEKTCSLYDTRTTRPNESKIQVNDFRLHPVGGSAKDRRSQNFKEHSEEIQSENLPNVYQRRICGGFQIL